MAGIGHIEDNFKNSPDIVRTYYWQVIIPEIGSVSETVKDADEIMFRARSITLPGRGVEKIESNFMGMKQFFPGRVTFTNSINLRLEETEDQVVSKCLYEWANKIFDVRTNTPTGGFGQVARKREIAKDIIINLLGYNKEPLQRSYKLINCFIENIEDIELSYETNDKIVIPVTLSYDFWTLDRSNG